MKLCKTCKHWERPDSEHGEVPGTGKCNAALQFWDVTEWGISEPMGITIRELKPEYANLLAFVEDGSNYHAALKTMANFGCVQHEEKTQ